MVDNQDDSLSEAENALERVQNYDPQKLVRRDELGKYAFSAAVGPAKRLISLFEVLSASHLEYFPTQQLNLVRDTANTVYNIFGEFENFDVESAQPSVSDAQTALISKLTTQYQHVFNQLSPLIAFSTARAQDFSALERDARAATQAAKDQANSLVSALKGQKDTADAILAEVRSAAAEQGVSKQAIHFKNEADKHHDESQIWLKRTILSSVVLVVYAFASIFIHNIPGTMAGPYGAIQLGISKVLIFGVIAYSVLLCARNFLSHKHNEIINRHRQNALATFTALAEATSDAASSDIVLSHAAACIFSPQETGYTKGDAAHPDGVPALQILPRIGGMASAQ
ncbi:hypothetical protein FSZ31_00280 [Sphingorhabdus soli]|uniref:Uncharacterized protein n=1 Tax=Flavisphingopyxis soli TaxID=2601267 RepID=A0A5C6UMB2_9SPHN|nr:hypothetical protein [Sphingorhabdus soli]TXC73241.1 hypothetical protein FSZ31_00280 [Sphingorhabdus soli]